MIIAAGILFALSIAAAVNDELGIAGVACALGWGAFALGV